MCCIADVLLRRAQGEITKKNWWNDKPVNIAGSNIELGSYQARNLQAIIDGKIKGDNAWEVISNILEKHGYDGIKYKNEYEGNKQDYSYIALRNTDVKSADPVTYDDNGNVIPLSERFNEKNQDIRYSRKLSEYQDMRMTDGKQITKPFAEALYNLSRGKYIALGDLYDIVEIAEGKAKLVKALENGESALLPGREAIRENAYKIISDFGSWTGKNARDREAHYGYNGDVRKGRRLDIVTGLPASGKSSAIVNDISQKYKSRLLDNDEIKKELDGYDNGWGAGFVHEESSTIEKEIFDDALERGDNIVYPKVGAAKKDGSVSVLKQIIKAKKHGYKVYVHHVALNPNKALGRMLERFVSRNRFLDPNLFEKYAPGGNDMTARGYEILKNEPLVDGYSEWDNDVAIGEHSILIETNMKGDLFDVNIYGSNRGLGENRGTVLSGSGGAPGSMGGTQPSGVHGKVQADSDRVQEGQRFSRKGALKIDFDTAVQLQEMNKSLRAEIDSLKDEFKRKPIDVKDFSNRITRTVRGWQGTVAPQEIIDSLLPAARKFLQNPNRANVAKLETEILNAANRIVTLNLIRRWRMEILYYSPAGKQSGKMHIKSFPILARGQAKMHVTEKPITVIMVM